MDISALSAVTREMLIASFERFPWKDAQQTWFQFDMMKLFDGYHLESAWSNHVIHNQHHQESNVVHLTTSSSTLVALESSTGIWRHPWFQAPTHYAVVGHLHM